MKSFLKYLAFDAVLLVSGCMMANAQTLHAVVFCNTIDESIGESMKLELMNVTRELKKINELIDYDEDFYQLDGPICTRANLKTAIDRMEVDENDVIITFYGGHGSHAPNNETDPWPQYCMNSGFENQSNWVPMASVAKWVQAKNPRLAIILSNCCNVVQGPTTIKPLWAMGGDYTRLSGVSAEKYKQLFSLKGLVMATSSKIPEPSWCNAAQGGLFTSDLIDVLQMVGSGSVQADWNSVLERTYSKTSGRDIIDSEGKHYRQHPYFEIAKNGREPITRRDTDRRSTDPLQQVLYDVVNKNTNESIRLGMIPGILSKHFGAIGKVMTVGTDLETTVDYENPKDFLRRICLSPFIKQVNILRKENGVLVVHEIRN